MHLTRQQTTTKLPIPRKGTKYLARALSHPKESVPVVIAVRDMLKLARTSREVKEMIKQKALKLNARPINDLRESIRLFNILSADKHYILTLNKARKFALEEIKNPQTRMCKVIGKTLLKNGKIQLNLHDGSNVLTKDKLSVNDTIYLDFEGKIKKHNPLEKASECFIIKGKYQGFKGKIEELNEKAKIKLENSALVTLEKRSIFVT